MSKTTFRRSGIEIFTAQRLFWAAALLLSLFLAGCSPRVSLDGERPGAEKGETPSAELLFSGSFSGSAPRAALTEEELLEPRKFIAAKDLRIVFYSVDELSKPQTVAFAFTRSFEIWRGEASGDDLESFSFDDKVLRLKGSETVPIDDYLVVCFTSAPAALVAATAPGKPYSELQKPIALDGDTGEGILVHSIYSNVAAPLLLRGETMREAAPGSPIEVSLTDLRALGGLVYVTADPVVADPGYFIPEDYPLYARVNVSNKTFLPHPAGVKVTLADGSEALIPEDGNYDTSSLSETGLRDEFFYLNLDGREVFSYNYYNFQGAGTLNPKAGFAMFVPENTVSHRSVSSLTATQLVVEAPIFPVELKAALEAAGLGANGDSWLEMADGKRYLGTSFQEVYDGALTKEATERTEEEAAVVAAGRNFTAHVKGVTPEELPADQPLSFPKRNYKDVTVAYHYHGHSFFLLPIRHFEDSKQPDPEQDGRYGVVRNTLYYYHITGFPGAGAPVLRELTGTTRHYEEERDLAPGSAASFADPAVISRSIAF